MDFLNNTEIVVGIGFVIFLAVILYYKVPSMLAHKLDERAVRIRAELDEARALREEAQTPPRGFERRQKEVKAQAEDIVAAARSEAEKAAEAAKADIRRSVARRMQTATEQIAAAEQSAIRQIKDQRRHRGGRRGARRAPGQMKAADVEPDDRRRDHRDRQPSCTEGVPPMATVEARKAQLEARLDRADRPGERIENELEQPVSDSFAEQAAEREEEEVLEDLGAAGVQEIRMIEAALDRIDQGPYGTCVVCGDPIGDDRLDALPATPLCATCAGGA